MLFKQHLGRIAARAALGFAALAALASCGGGTYQVTSFVPARILTFGDESSRLQGTQGLKYSINGLSSTGSLQTDCTVSPIWTQVVANGYGLVYSNCNINASPYTNAIDLSVIGGTVDDVVAKVAAFQAGDTFNSNDLVTMWVGMNDVVNEYELNATGDQTAVLQEIYGQGAKLAAVVNQIANAGAKVLLLTVPDMSLSPFGYLEAQRGDFDRAKLLSNMTTQFNLGLRSNILNDGSKIGLVLVDDIVRNDVRSPGSFGLISLPNQSYGCLDTAPLPTCTTDTLRADPSTGQAATLGFLWADATHLGPVAQNQIGSQALGRARANPF